MKLEENGKVTSSKPLDSGSPYPRGQPLGHLERLSCQRPLLPSILPLEQVRRFPLFHVAVVVVVALMTRGPTSFPKEVRVLSILPSASLYPRLGWIR